MDVNDRLVWLVSLKSAENNKSDLAAEPIGNSRAARFRWNSRSAFKFAHCKSAGRLAAVSLDAIRPGI